MSSLTLSKLSGGTLERPNEDLRQNWVFWANALQGEPGAFSCSTLALCQVAGPKGGSPIVCRTKRGQRGRPTKSKGQPRRSQLPFLVETRVILWYICVDPDTSVGVEIGKMPVKALVLCLLVDYFEALDQATLLRVNRSNSLHQDCTRQQILHTNMLVAAALYEALSCFIDYKL